VVRDSDLTGKADRDVLPVERMCRLSDGRQITIRETGDARGRPVIVLHGTPGSRLKFDAAGLAAGELGLRLIAPDRWGYGGTSSHPSPTLPVYADDIAALADWLRIDRFAVMGVSGGGPYAASVAASLGDRIDALALVAPVGPIAGLDDVRLRAFHRFCFGRFARSPASIAVVFAGLRRLLKVAPDLAMKLAMLDASPADRKVLATRGVEQRLARTFATGLEPGTSGPVTDLALFSRSWNVPLGNVSAEARIWIGTADRNVPISAVERLGRDLPRCSVEWLQGAGHLWVALNYAEVLGWISKTKGAAVTAP
jgi:pimeloyl-ACP methyl ester carboxylesterase